MYLLGGQTKKLMTWKLNSNFIFRTQNKLLKFTLFPGGFPGGSGVKNPSAKTGDSGLIPESGRSPREGNGNPFQYSCLGNLMDRGAWGLHSLGTFYLRDSGPGHTGLPAFLSPSQVIFVCLFCVLFVWFWFLVSVQWDIVRELINRVGQWHALNIW